MILRSADRAAGGDHGPSFRARSKRSRPRPARLPPVPADPAAAPHGRPGRPAGPARCCRCPRPRRAHGGDPAGRTAPVTRALAAVEPRGPRRGAVLRHLPADGPPADDARAAGGAAARLQPDRGAVRRPPPGSPQLADRHGFLLAAPRQTRGHQAGGCWRWYESGHQARGAGEPAILAGITAAVLAEPSRWRIDPARVYAAGISAGGAMALILGATYPGRVRRGRGALGSGLPVGERRPERAGGHARPRRAHAAAPGRPDGAADRLPGHGGRGGPRTQRRPGDRAVARVRHRALRRSP